MASPALSYYIHAPNQPGGPLRLPRRIAADALDRIPEAYRIAYIEEDDGTGYFLSTRTADAIRDGEAELASLNAQLAKIQVEGPAKLAATKEAMRNDAINTALQSALATAGVKEGLLEAAIALVKKKNAFEAEKSADGAYAVEARTKFGLATVDAVVQQFMDDEGAAYREKPTAPSAGSHFSQLQSGLKRPH
ncbi:hypothetical protein NKH94_15620 [Mesorhizobium australicum]|uniref:hypothetical protein n=1 Tax=Mesorhizobium australicum TaxID=536018 RepID=UPI00333825B9